MFIEFLLRFAGFIAPLSISMAQIGYGIILVFFIYGITKRQYPGIGKNTYIKYMAFVIGIIAITSLLGDDPARSFRKYKQVFLPLTFFIGYYMCRRPRLDGVIFWTVAGGAVASVFGLIRFFMHYGPVDRSAGMFASPVRFGNIMALIVILGLGMLLFRLYRSARERNIYIATTLMSVVGLFSSTTRGAMIACFVGMFILFLVVFRWKGLALSVAVMFLSVAAIFMMPELRSKFYDALMKWNDPTTSLGWRFVLWVESWQVFKGNPITGVGLANLSAGYLQAIPIKHQSVAHAHNNFLQILAEHGLFGFIALAALYIRLFIDQLSGALRRNSFAFVGMAFLVVFMVEGISEYVLYDGEISMLFWFITGGLLRAQHDELDQV